MFKLGRKDIRPKVMEMTIKYSKEAEEHDIDEHGNRNEDEKLAHDHESEEHEVSKKKTVAVRKWQPKKGIRGMKWKTRKKA
nr:histone-lysine N-methyltransferase, H3 lysine-79 specific-like [Tanacetum cinerariifolium]